MYEELVKALRETRDSVRRHPDVAMYVPPYQLSAAADAIEELSRRETPMRITEIHVDEYYCQACGAENNCDQGCVQDAYCPACGQLLLPEPPKEAEEI